LFREQADGCARLGSPLYAGLLAHAADDLDAGGVLTRTLAGHENDPGPSALALRLAGAVHRITLDGRAPDLAAYYPSVGGTPEIEKAWIAFRDTVAEHHDEVRRLLRSPPQTNEAGRSAVLLGGLLHVAERTGLPIRLLEIGASAGLNLRVDHFCFVLSDTMTIGDPTSLVTLRYPWTPEGEWPPVDAPLRIVERRGCDVDPADAASADGRLRLTSYVWPDQTERLERLWGACAVAQQVPAPVEQMHAADFLARELAGPCAGVATVVWHSVVWQYLDERERDAIYDTLDQAGARATASAPLALLSFEPRRVDYGDWFAFLASLTIWPGEGRHVIAEGQGHGPPVTWR
jgi:hypothetical protein